MVGYCAPRSQYCYVPAAQEIEGFDWSTASSVPEGAGEWEAMREGALPGSCLGDRKGSTQVITNQLCCVGFSS